jgi:hypothetical protein
VRYALEQFLSLVRLPISPLSLGGDDDAGYGDCSAWRCGTVFSGVQDLSFKDGT